MEIKRQLWAEAADLARDDTSGMNHSSTGSHVSIEDVHAAVQNKLDECTRKRWKYIRSDGQKVVLWDVLNKIAKWVNKFKEVGDVAIQCDAGHVALPWAAIRFMLQASVSSVETFGHMLEGVELSSKIIATYAEVERTCLNGVSRLKTQLVDAIIKMYAGVLAFLSRARQYFGQSSGKRALKGAFQSYQTSVDPWIERINNAEKDVLKLIGLVQAEDQMNLLVTTRRAVLDIKENMTDSKVPKDERRRLVHGWLEAISTAEIFHKAHMVRHEKTCNWIFARPDFQEWESRTDNIAKPKILWIHSGPGFGKTVLCAKIIDHMFENGVLLVYFFCVADEETKRQPYAIIRSWIDQLAHVNEDALDIVHEMYEAVKPRAPTPAELWSIFNTLGKAIPCAFVIDGFDECSTTNKNSQRHTADGRSEFLEYLIKNTADTRARVLILSRDNEDIRAQLGTLTKDTTPMLLEYGISADDTRKDIDRCSSHMVDTRLANKPTELKAYLASEAARRSDGMFLWLQYLSHELDPGENAKALRNIVSEMPAGINEMYERDLEKVQSLKPAKKVRAIAVLRWILFALRPLTVRELAEAIAATIDDSAETYPHNDLPDSWDSGYVDEQYVNSYIRRSCGSLVELRGHVEKKPLALHTVHFTHFSVKEYLLHSDIFNNAQTRLERICFPDGGKEHDRLARLCLQYLCYDIFGEKNDFRDGTRIQVYPFLAYAAKYWYMHALRYQRMSEDILPWAENLFNPSTSNWILWSRVFEGDLQLDDDTSSACSLRGEYGSVTSSDEAEELDDVDNRPGLIYYAALFGLTNIVKALQSQGLDCSARGGIYGFPLQAAIHNSHQETVEYLVQQGIDLNQRGGVYTLAICAAAAQGLDNILDILIKAGADPTSEDQNGRNALHFACGQGARATVKPLLEAGADPLKTSRLGKTPFYEAVESGDRETVSLILDAGVSANHMNKTGVPAICTAVSLGYEGIVEELLNRHADVNLLSPRGLTCLHEAVIKGHTAIIEKLLVNSAEVNAQDQEGWSPLCYAVALKNFTSAELLISRGAYVNTSTNDGCTPLHIAVESASNKRLAMLLSHGAAVDAESSSRNTSLFSAVFGRCLECVKILLAHGASVAQINIRGNTVLDDAIESGQKDIIEYLLDHNALCGLGDHIQGTSASPTDVQSSIVAAKISKAILRGDEDLASQLISNRDSALSKSDLNRALRLCSSFNATSLVESLLQRGASLSASTYNERTPLHFTTKNNSLELTKLFLKHGATIHAVDGSGYTPLDLAISGGLANIETTKYLVENGTLATQGGGDTAPEMSTNPALEGHWKGTYTYDHWRKGRVEATVLTIRFAPTSLSSKYPFLKCRDRDEIGIFEVLGHLFADNAIRFAKLYKSFGWLYLGIFDADAMIIRGTWGSSMTLHQGSFELKKV